MSSVQSVTFSPRDSLADQLKNFYTIFPASNFDAARKAAGSIAAQLEKQYGVPLEVKVRPFEFVRNQFLSWSVQVQTKHLSRMLVEIQISSFIVADDATKHWATPQKVFQYPEIQLRVFGKDREQTPTASAILKRTPTMRDVSTLIRKVRPEHFAAQIAFGTPPSSKPTVEKRSILKADIVRTVAQVSQVFALNPETETNQFGERVVSFEADAVDQMLESGRSLDDVMDEASRIKKALLQKFGAEIEVDVEESEPKVWVDVKFALGVSLVASRALVAAWGDVAFQRGR